MDKKGKNGRFDKKGILPNETLFKIKCFVKLAVAVRFIDEFEAEEDENSLEYLPFKNISFNDIGNNNKFFFVESLCVIANSIEEADANYNGQTEKNAQAIGKPIVFSHRKFLIEKDDNLFYVFEWLLYDKYYENYHCNAADFVKILRSIADDIIKLNEKDDNSLFWSDGNNLYDYDEILKYEDYLDTIDNKEKIKYMNNL